MPFVKINSIAFDGIDAVPIDIEVNLDNRGFPGFEIIGLPAREINESRERIKAVIRNSGYKFPSRKILVNLAPANLPKKGSLYDIPIAIGILAASGVLGKSVLDYIFFGELSLNGSVLPTKGVTVIGEYSVEKGPVFVCPEDAKNITFIDGIRYFAVENLKDIVTKINFGFSYQTSENILYEELTPELLLLNKIKGHESSKRAILIAVAGKHNICIIGSAGSGKTILAQSIKDIAPKLQDKEFLESAKIRSFCGLPLSANRIFRSPSHPLTLRKLIGTSISNLGEITLAHKGVLFLDEFLELKPEIINLLRQPIETKTIQTSYGGIKRSFPADFMLVIATNPCACGNYGDPSKDCICDIQTRSRYIKKFQNPFMDRIDMRINVFSVDASTLVNTEYVDNIDYIQIVEHTLSIQKARCDQYKMEFTFNGDLNLTYMEKVCRLNSKCKDIIAKLNKKLSSRSVHKIIKVARTIADIEAEDEILPEHIYEANQYKFDF